MFSINTDPPDPVSVPKAREAVWVERLLWVFLMSFALDYRNSVAREGAGGTGIDQLLFLATCFFSSCAILWLGRRYLTVRPGCWMLAFWGLFLAYMLGNSALQGVNPGRSLRVALPLVFCFFGMANAHVAGCMGIRPSRIVTPVLVAACVNVMWRIFHGFVFKDASIETVRLEVQSPANSWIAAWIGCAILLRGRFQWNLIVACGVLFIGIFITVTRSLIFPVMASALAAGFCFVLGVVWKQFEWTSLMKRLLPVAGVMALVLFALGAVAVVEPLMIERWNERLFHNAGAQNLGSDISYLTRKAEADAIWKILSDDPIHFIHGRGFGCSYYWDAAYLPEIWKVLPKKETDVDDIWFAGHSVWTYGLLSGGVIALAAYLGLFAGTALMSLLAARANSTDPGPDQWLAFLPFIATCCLISETLTANPFQERLTGILFGVMAGLSQAFMVRASLDPYRRSATGHSIDMTKAPVKTVALVDPVWVGHHPMYFTQFTESFLRCGARVIGLCPDPEGAMDDLTASLGQSEAEDLAGRVHFAMLRTGKRSFFNGRFEGDPARTFLRWRTAADALADAEANCGMRADLVYFPYLDSYLRFLPFPVVPDATLNRPWSGLYLRNHHHGENPSLKKNLRLLAKGDAILRSNQCRGIGVLDERFIEAIERLTHKPVTAYPDVTQGGLPAEAFPLALEIQRKAKGRKIIGIIGLERRKGFLTLLRTSGLARKAQLPFYFACAGALHRSEYNAEELAEIDAAVNGIASGTIDNLHFDPTSGRIRDEADFNFLFSCFDIAWAAYEDFQGSSGTLSKAALFEIPCLATEGECIGQRIDRYRMGLTIPEATPQNALEAISHLAAGTDRKGEALNPRYGEYREDHSLEKLDRILGELLTKV